MEEIFLPAMGMAMESATLVEWHQEEGARIEVGEEVALVESDKSTVGLTAPVAGRLGRHLFQVGDAVPAGATVARVLVGDEVEPSLEMADIELDVDLAVGAPTAVSSAADTAESAPTAVSSAAGVPNARSPRRRRELQEERAAAALAPARAPRPTPLPPAAPGPVDGREARRRASIAASVSESWREIPHFAVSREIAADELPDALRRLRRREPDLTVGDFLLAAVVRVLRGTNRPADVGLAVATRAGVALTVLRDLEDAPEAITPVRRDAVERARALRGEPDPGPAPFLTLSNIGALGVSWFTGIVPLGQTALLTTGSLNEQPVVRAGRIVVGAQFGAVLNADHRILDGVDAARLLRDFDRELQDVLQEVGE